MSDDYKAELKRDYCVFILDKVSVSNIETKGQQHVDRVNLPSQTGSYNHDLI